MFRLRFPNRVSTVLGTTITTAKLPRLCIAVCSFSGVTPSESFDSVLQGMFSLLHQDLTLSTSSLNADAVGGFAPDITVNHYSLVYRAGSLSIVEICINTLNFISSGGSYASVSEDQAPTLKQPPKAHKPMFLNNV